MPDPLSRLSTLNRPRILVRAARIGIADYNRGRSLKRLMPGEALPSPGLAFDALLEREAALDAVRRDGGAAYSAARHVELLAALINEARLAECRSEATQRA